MSGFLVPVEFAHRRLRSLVLSIVAFVDLLQPHLDLLPNVLDPLVHQGQRVVVHMSLLFGFRHRCELIALQISLRPLVFILQVYCPAQRF